MGVCKVKFTEEALVSALGLEEHRGLVVTGADWEKGQYVSIYFRSNKIPNVPEGSEFDKDLEWLQKIPPHSHKAHTGRFPSKDVYRLDKCSYLPHPPQCL